MHEATPANGPDRRTDWDCVDWRKANRIVRNLRQRIFRASREGKHRTVQSLQKLMLRCASNRLLSVRRVTRVNAGRYTPGVDQVVVKTPAARGKLVDELSTYQPWRAKPARRAYIPKANGKLRPLGIPVVTDRCLQAMVKQALEPAWEAQFEGNSYGFRPGRGCHDAMSRIHQLGKSGGTKPWVVDADIVGALDVSPGTTVHTPATPAQALGLAQSALLGPTEHQETRHLGVWRQTNGSIPPEVRLDRQQTAYPRQRHILPG